MPLAVEDRLKEVYDQLPPSEKALADMIIDFPGVLATHTITEIADRVKTSKAAATRLIKRLGYKNVQELRKHAREAREGGAPRYLNTFSLDRDPPEGRLKQHIENEVQNLLRSFEGIREDTLNAVVDALATARTVWIVGFGNSHMAAQYLRQQIVQLRGHVEALPKPGQTLAKDLSGLSMQDMVVVIGFRRRNEMRHRLLDYANSIGAPCLYITDHSELNAEKLANWVIRCEVQSTSLFDSYSASYSILNYIAASLSDRLGKDAAKRLTNAEKIQSILGEN